MVVVYVTGRVLRWTVELDKQSCQECAPLLQHVESDIAKFPALVIFVAAYGCIGLEVVSIEHDNPCGADPSDVDVLILDKVRQF
jgi:predicted membrane chloride channel (bestrophin family)